jgi:hypothetical protein
MSVIGMTCGGPGESAGKGAREDAGEGREGERAVVHACEVIRITLASATARRRVGIPDILHPLGDAR